MVEYPSNNKASKMNDIKQQVIDTIANALGVDRGVLTDDLSIGDIPEWDSVGNMTIISAIEEKMGVEFPIDDLFDLSSIAALVEKVEKLKA